MTNRLLDRDDELIQRDAQVNAKNIQEMKDQYITCLRDLASYYDHNLFNSGKEEQFLKLKVNLIELGRHKGQFPPFTDNEKADIKRWFLKIQKGQPKKEENSGFLHSLRTFCETWENASSQKNSFSVRGRIMKEFKERYDSSYRKTLTPEQQAEYDNYIAYLCSVSPTINEFVSSGTMEKGGTKERH